MCFVNTGNSSPNISQFAENNKGTLAASSMACFLLTAKIAAQPAGDNVGCQCFCKPVMCSRCVCMSWATHRIDVSTMCHHHHVTLHVYWREVDGGDGGEVVGGDDSSRRIFLSITPLGVSKATRGQLPRVFVDIFDGKEIYCIFGIFGWGLFGIRHKQLPS